MLHGKKAEAAILMQLIRRLVADGILKRETALALFGDVADQLLSNPKHANATVDEAVDTSGKNGSPASATHERKRAWPNL